MDAQLLSISKPSGVSNSSIASRQRYSEYNRIPPSTKNKSVIYYNRKTKEYQISDDFFTQVSNTPEDKKKIEITKNFLKALNNNSKVFPFNQSISWYKWVIAWLISFIVLLITLWILHILIIFSLFNLVALVFAGYIVWFVINKIAVLVTAFFTFLKMKKFRHFLKEERKKLGEDNFLKCSHDGLYLELYFNKDEVEDRLSKYIVSSTIFLDNFKN